MSYNIIYCGYAENEASEQTLAQQEHSLPAGQPYLRWGLPGSKCILTIVENPDAAHTNYRLYVIFPQEAWQGGVSEEDLKQQAQARVTSFLQGNRDGWQPSLEFPDAFETTVLNEDSALT